MAEPRQPTADINPPGQPNWWVDLLTPRLAEARTEQREQIAYFLEGEALRYGGQVRDATELLRELARRIRAGDLT